MTENHRPGKSARLFSDEVDQGFLAMHPHVQVELILSDANVDLIDDINDDRNTEETKLTFLELPMRTL